ncbi:Fc.00g046260.m01.CDS01 [Cosmosporella sp. VM-42]
MEAEMALPIAIGALMIVSILELSFITAMVGWLHDTASGTFVVRFNGSIFDLAGEPKNLLVDQGHTSNGAAGTALVLVGLGGIVVLWLRNRPNFRHSRLSVVVYYIWLVINVMSLLLVLGALAYVFAVTNAHRGQNIDAALASRLKGQKYPIDTWTPQNWFSAMLKLDLADDSVRNDISKHLRLMRGWQYNLIPFFLVHLAETGLALFDALQMRRAGAYASVSLKADARS